VASLSQGRTAAAQCGLFTYKSVPVIFEPPCICNKQHLKGTQFFQGACFATVMTPTQNTKLTAGSNKP